MTTISKGNSPFIVSGSGVTSTGETIVSGGTMLVSAGGIAVGTIIDSTGFGPTNGGLFVLSGGTTSGSLVGSGGQELVSFGGTDVSAAVATGGELVVASGGLSISAALIGGVIGADGTGILETGGVISRGGTGEPATVSKGGTFEYIGVNINTDGGANVDFRSGATLEVGSGASFIGSGVTLINVNNTIAGLGTISGLGALVNSGTIDANSFLGVLSIDAPVINKGVMEVTAPATLVVGSGGTNLNVVEAVGAGHVEITAPFANSKTIEALNGELIVSGGTVVNSSTGLVLVSGSATTLFIESGTIAGGKLQSLAGAQISAGAGTNVLSGVTIASGTLVQDTGELMLEGSIVNSGTFEVMANATLDLNNAAISGGKLQTSGANALIDTVSGSTDLVHGGTIVSGSVFDVVSGSTLTLSGVTIGAGVSLSATSGSTMIVSGLLVDSGTLTLSGVTSIASGATIETLSGGAVTFGGAVTNSGTLFASGAGTLVEIDIDATVTGGGAAKIGNGILDIVGTDNQNVTFIAGGSGGLEIGDGLGDDNAYTGVVSGFGGPTHTNSAQFIELVAVTSGPVMGFNYASTGTNSGVLTVFAVTSATPVAVINFAGSYVTSDFKLSAGSGGDLVITDPGVTDGASVTLGYSGNGGLLGDGAAAAALVRLAQHMAGSFVTGAGQGGNPVSASQPGQAAVLTHPHTT